MVRKFENEDEHLGHLLLQCWKRRPNEICHIDAATGEKRTNAATLSRTVALARSLRKIGLRPGDVMALGGNNHIDIHIPYYAALMNGLPVVGVDPLFKYAEIHQLLELTEPKIVFCQPQHQRDYSEAAKQLELDLIIVTFDVDNNLDSFIEGCVDQDIEEFQPASFDLDKIYSSLVSTSGTTGVPKVAAYTHTSIIDKMSMFDPIDFDAGTKGMLLNLSPIQWVSAIFNSICSPLMNLTILQTSAPQTPAHVIDIINNYRPQRLLTSPSLLALVFAQEKHCDWTCFDQIIVTGSKAYQDTLQQLQSVIRPDAVMLEGYGQTENMGLVLMPNPQGPLGNCGIPMPTYQLKLLDFETGKEIAEPYVTGELLTKGPAFAGYYKNPQETKKAFTEDGWYKTGDLLYRDEENNYYFVDRNKMLIKCRCTHVIPTELEALLRQHDGIRDVAVTSVPHPVDGERPAACVVRAHENLTVDDVKDIIASKLSENKHLSGGVVFVDEIPLTSTGKIARTKLRQLVLSQTSELNGNCL